MWIKIPAAIAFVLLTTIMAHGLDVKPLRSNRHYWLMIWCMFTMWWDSIIIFVIAQTPQGVIW